MTGRSSGTPVRVLHVDDEPGFAELVVARLEREDERFHVDAATSADDGLEHLLAGDYDCVVSDYDMPAEDGIAFLETVREHDPRMPFILFTGKGSEEIASEAISAGVSDYLQKEPGGEQYELLANRILNQVERTRAQRDLAERESHLEHAQAIADIGSWHLDLETDELGWSEEVYDLFGIPETESLDYERFLEFVHPEDREAVDGEWQAALGGADYDIEHRIVTEDGETRWVRQRADVAFAADGTPRSALGIVQDVTDRRERERQLRVARQAIQAAGHVIYWTDSDGVIQYVNPAFEETTGWDAEDAIGRTPAILNSDTHEEDFFAELWETIAAGETWRSEVVNTTESGETYIVDQTIAPVENARGEIEHYLAVNADVTAQKKYEFDLERYEAIVEESEDGIYVFDEAGNCEYVNQRVVDVSGLSRGDWQGANVEALADFDVLTEAEVEAIRAGIDSVLETDETEIRVELEPDVPHDLEVLELRLTPFKPEDGLVIGFSRDVTDRRARERALERQNERLDQFASVVSHDLRNPLNVASGRLELARRDADGEHLAAVAAAHDRIETQIDDLLTLAREGEPAEDLAAVDVGDVAARCWEHVETADATLVVDGEPQIWAARGRLKHVLENLIRNAVEHGGSDVTVSVGGLPDGFYVADDGTGIPTDEHEQAFEAGYSTSGRGTGLGLTIVEQVAVAHGWAVEVTEGRDGGARFEFRDVTVVD